MTALSAAILAAVAAVGLALLPVLFVGTIVVLVKLARRLAAHEPVEPAVHAPPVAVGATAGRTGPLVRAPRLRRAPASRAACGPDQREALAVWRYRQLLQLDVDPVAALGASLVGVDTSSVRSLTRRGCPPALALAIVAPLTATPSRRPEPRRR